MFPSGFTEEIKRLCSLIYGDAPFVVWYIAGNTSCVISPNGTQICTPEEHALLHRLPESYAKSGFQLPASHVLFQGLSLKSDVMCLRKRLQNGELITGVSAAYIEKSELLLNLVSEKEQDWQLRQHLGQLIDYQQQQIAQLEERNRLLMQQRVEWTKQHVHQWIAEQHGISVVIEEACWDKLNEFSGTAELRQSLDHALRLTRFTHPTGTFCRITPAHLQIVPVVKEPVPTPLQPLQRVELLLDKYEAAARTAQQLGYAVNGKTIAEHLQPSISPPAITDALKKNRKAIGNLLEQYPERWGLLRKYLKPVKELNDHRLYQLS